MQNADSERKTTASPPRYQSPHCTSIPPLLTKAFLYQYYGIPAGGQGSRGLRKHVLTDEVLQAAGIPIDGYKNMKYFTALQSNRLREILQL